MVPAAQRVAKSLRWVLGWGCCLGEGGVCECVGGWGSLVLQEPWKLQGVIACAAVLLCWLAGLRSSVVGQLDGLLARCVTWPLPGHLVTDPSTGQEKERGSLGCPCTGSRNGIARATSRAQASNWVTGSAAALSSVLLLCGFW